MKSDLINLVVFAAIFFILLILVEIAYRKYSLPSEFTRKTVHIIAGTTSSFFIFIFEKLITGIIMAFGFLLLVWISKRMGFLKSIHTLKRSSVGVILFPVSVCLVFVLNRLTEIQNFAYFASILVLSISDPLAAFGGFLNSRFSQKFNGFIFNNSMGAKTWFGSIFFFISSFTILFLTYSSMVDLSIHASLKVAIVIAMIATLIELVSLKGWDNLTTPVSVWLCIYLERSFF